VCSARVADTAAGAGAAGSCGRAGDRWCWRAVLGRSLRQGQGLKKVGQRNVGEAGRRAAKRVDLHNHITKSEERRDSLSLPIALRAERSVLGLELDICLSTGEWARQLSRQRARGGGGGGAAPPLGVHAGAGWAELHLVLTAGDIGRHSRGSSLGQVAHDVGRLSMQPSVQRAPRGEVVISPQTHPRPRMEPALGRGSAQYVRRGCR